MSKKNTQSSVNGTASIGEISTIRDILMGEHISQFEKRFMELQDQLANVENKLSNKIKELSQKTNSQNKDMNKEMNGMISSLETNTEARFSLLEKSLQDGLANLESMLEETSLNDKERIGKLLMEAGKNLIKS